MSPLQEHARPLRCIWMSTVEHGDCGLDAMAFWDGSERTDKTWKALRLELAGVLEACADDPDPVWQAALAACGEVAPAVAIAASFFNGRPGRIRRPRAITPAGARHRRRRWTLGKRGAVLLRSAIWA